MAKSLVYIGVILTVVNAAFFVVNWLLGNYAVAMLNLGISLFCGIMTFVTSRDIK